MKNVQILSLRILVIIFFSNPKLWKTIYFWSEKEYLLTLTIMAFNTHLFYFLMQLLIIIKLLVDHH